MVSGGGVSSVTARAVSDENANVVRAALSARSGARGKDEILKFLDPAIEWAVRADLPDHDTYKGHEGVRRLQSRFAEVIENIWLEPREFITAGDRLVVALRWGGRGLGSGVEFVEREETWIFTVRGGKIVRISEYATKAGALAAAGLSE